MNHRDYMDEHNKSVFFRSQDNLQGTPPPVVACVLTKVGKPHQGSGKHKGASRDFFKKTHFKP